MPHNRYLLTYILLVIFIILLLVRYYYVNQNIFQSGGEHSTVATISSDNCRSIKDGGLFFFLPRCEQYLAESAVLLTGKPSVETANLLSFNATVTDQAISVVANHCVSGIAGWCQFSVFVSQIRRSLLEKLAAELPNLEANLVAGILVGYQASWSDRVNDQLTVTNLHHVMAASGANISLVILLTGITVRPLKLSRGELCGVLLVSCAVYAQLVGWQPPITRAWLMAGLGLIGQYVVQRPTRAGLVLIMVAATMLIVQPAAWWSVSWQLSMAATAALAWLLPLLTTTGFWSQLELGVVPRQIPTWSQLFWEPARISLVAQLGVSPVLAVHFGQFNLAGLVSNSLLGFIPDLLATISLGSLFLGVFIPDWMMSLVWWPVLVIARFFWIGVEGVSYLDWLHWTEVEFPAVAVLAWLGFWTLAVNYLQYRQRKGWL